MQIKQYRTYTLKKKKEKESKYTLEKEKMHIPQWVKFVSRNQK